MPIMLFVILALVFVILLIVITNIVIVPQSMTYVIERLGSYSDSWSAGLHVKIPFVERVAKKVSLKEQVADFPPQPVITRDNVTIYAATMSSIFFFIRLPLNFANQTCRPFSTLYLMALYSSSLFHKMEAKFSQSLKRCAQIRNPEF